MIALQNKQEEQLILIMRELPDEMRETLFKTAADLREEQEDAEDLRIALERMNEPSIPASEVYKRLGLG